LVSELAVTTPSPLVAAFRSVLMRTSAEDAGEVQDDKQSDQDDRDGDPEYRKNENTRQCVYIKSDCLVP